MIRLRNIARTFTTLSALALILFGCAPQLAAQEAAKDAKAGDAKGGEAKPGPEGAPKEEVSVTEHTIRLGGANIAYKATASTTFLKDDKGEPLAAIYSTAYTRTDVKDPSPRPLAFIYNGGPGSASLWLHMGAFGPRKIVTAEAAPTPPPPYHLADNNDCLLDKTDMVFIDPVGTGFSHVVGKGENKNYWGIDEDARSLADFIMTYVTKNSRWNSPKFLIGESYGTFRSAALGNLLQQRYHMDINGIVLISSVLDTSTLSFTPGNDMIYIFYLPSYAATAWIHNLLKDKPADLDGFLNEARHFAATEYAAALMKGSHLTDAEKTDLGRKLARYTALSEDYLRKADYRVTLSQFRAELERSKGLTVGRYDSRFEGPTVDLLTEHAENDASYYSVAGAFTAAINAYLRDELKFSTDRTYQVLTPEPSQNWNWKHGQGGGFPGAPSVTSDLVNAMVTNPRLQVLVENGYYDMATPFFATEWTMDHLFLPGDLRSHVHLSYFGAGHMMYLREEDHDRLCASVRSFIETATKQ